MKKRNISFEQSFSTIQTDCALAPGGMYIQSLDAYGFQRELILRPTHLPADPKNEFEVHAYRHPGCRHISFVSAKIGIEFIDTFCEQALRYPVLMFSESNPRNRGFVHLHEKLLWGEPLTLSMLM